LHGLGAPSRPIDPTHSRAAHLAGCHQFTERRRTWHRANRVGHRDDGCESSAAPVVVGGPAASSAPACGWSRPARPGWVQRAAGETHRLGIVGSVLSDSPPGGRRTVARSSVPVVAEAEVCGAARVGRAQIGVDETDARAVWARTTRSSRLWSDCLRGRRGQHGSSGSCVDRTAKVDVVRRVPVGSAPATLRLMCGPPASGTGHAGRDAMSSRDECVYAEVGTLPEWGAGSVWLWVVRRRSSPSVSIVLER
jgi:hypothetical protein